MLLVVFVFCFEMRRAFTHVNHIINQIKRYKVLTVMSMKITAPGVVLSCSLVGMYQRSGVMSCFHCVSCILSQSFNLMEGMKQVAYYICSLCTCFTLFVLPYCCVLQVHKKWSTDPNVNIR